MKSCFEKVSAGDVVIWRMPYGEPTRFFICEKPSCLRTNYFLAECKEWLPAANMWEDMVSIGTFDFNKILAIEKAKRKRGL